mmetsp:Transcript_15743/g.17672  ORF Transcript_15743/g.17672 Transcript_15743/m.17672 type:complete len:241 (-) Transcript_15743:1675-2397(-)
MNRHSPKSTSSITTTIFGRQIMKFCLCFHHLPPRSSSFNFAFLKLDINSTALISEFHLNSMLTLCHILSCLGVHSWSWWRHKIFETLQRSFAISRQDATINNIGESLSYSCLHYVATGITYKFFGFHSSVGPTSPFCWQNCVALFRVKITFVAHPTLFCSCIRNCVITVSPCKLLPPSGNSNSKITLSHLTSVVESCRQQLNLIVIVRGVGKVLANKFKPICINQIFVNHPNSSQILVMK